MIKGKNRQEGFICWIAAHTLISSRGIPREGAIGSFWACKPQKTCQFTAVLLQSHMFYHTEDWASPNWKEMKNNYKFSNHNSRKPHRNEKLECSQCCSPLPETWKPTLKMNRHDWKSLIIFQSQPLKQATLIPDHKIHERDDHFFSFIIAL